MSIPGPGQPALQTVLTELVEAGRPSISFEFFPPKDDAAEAVLWQAIRRLEQVNPAFVSVTYGAGGSTRDRTSRITRQIAQTTTLTPMAHLTCVGATRAQLRTVIGEYADGGVQNVMVIRGDPPAGPAARWTPHPGGLNYAVELVALVRELGRFSVGVGAFPQVHPASQDADQDARILAAKAEAGASFAVTQMFFDADDYFRLVERAALHGCTIPIIPGIMPITNVRQVARFGELSGRPVPADLIARFEALAGDPAAVRAAGVEEATRLSQQVLAGGAPGLHFYTLNRSTATLDVFSQLGLAAVR
jgi:methylenetetrahydrofolate reductase (NADPH)